MAEYSIKDIASRIKNVESTRQIVKAMELISSSKLQKYRARLEKIRPFSDSLNEFIKIICKNDDFKKFMSYKKTNSDNLCYVVIGGDKGLAGGYNTNILKLFEKKCSNSKNSIVLPIGKKVIDYLYKKNIDFLSDQFYVCEKISFEDCKKISDILLKEYFCGKFNKIFLIYTKFISSLKQISNIVQLFPIDIENLYKNNEKDKCNFLFEPNCEECIKRIISYYISGTIWSAICESLASEFGARHTAMESANKNACEMVENLSLTYNQLRQSAITQEITEIVAGI